MKKKTTRSWSGILCGTPQWEWHRGNAHYYVTVFGKESWSFITPDWRDSLWSDHNNGYRFATKMDCHPAPAVFGAE